jgi:hypothetical protein
MLRWKRLVSSHVGLLLNRHSLPLATLSTFLGWTKVNCGQSHLGKVTNEHASVGPAGISSRCYSVDACCLVPLDTTALW